MPSERAPELAEVIRRALDARLGEVHSAMPARVVKWDAAKQAADCQPLVQRAYLDERGARQVATLPVIPGVPVMFQGGGPFRLTFPLSDGSLVIDGDTIPATTGTLFFAECSLDRWLTGKGEIVDPEIDHGFALHDGIFVPGLHPFGAPLGSCPTDHATLGHDSGVQIHFHKGTIAIGDESGNAFIARADKDDDNWTKLKTAIQSWTPVANDGGAALKTILMALITGPPAWPASVAATQGKVK